jgi:hypothetical protein
MLIFTLEKKRDTKKWEEGTLDRLKFKPMGTQKYMTHPSLELTSQAYFTSSTKYLYCSSHNK